MHWRPMADNSISAISSQLPSTLLCTLPYKLLYGEAAGKQEAEAMMILITGTFLCNYNGVLTGGINHNIIGYLSNLAKS